MRFILLCLLFCTSLLQASDPDGTGEWSVTKNGLRGRLVYSEGKLVSGTRIARLYLELENVSDLGSPLLLNSHSPKVDVTDAAGKSIPQVDRGDYMSPLPYTLVLPLGATIRLLILIKGYDIWIIPNETGEERYLSGTFAVPELKPTDFEGRHKDSRQTWRGTLDLPKLKLPTSAK